MNSGNRNCSKTNYKYKKHRRKRKQSHNISKKQQFSFMNCNASSLKSKLKSFENVLKNENPAVFCLQETHFRRPGMIKVHGIEEFEIFELIREGKGGGGLALGAKKSLSPLWINDGGNKVEAITVQITVQGHNVRITNAYGPQNYSDADSKFNFWSYLEKEVIESANVDAGCIIAMDSNSWLGNNYFNLDPNPQNENRKMFMNFLERNENISVLNMHPKCEGSITRSRKVGNNFEESVLDYILVCDKMLPFFDKMVVDEKKVLSLTNLRGKNISEKAKVSDHNVIMTEFSLKFSNKVVNDQRTTKFNFNDEEGMLKYKQITSKAVYFLDCFRTDKTFLLQFKEWEKKFNQTLSKCFKKVRVNKKRKCNDNSKRLENKINLRKEAIQNNAEVEEI